MTTATPCRSYRRGGLGYLVCPPYPAPWFPPPALAAHQDPVLMARVLAALRRL